MGGDAGETGQDDWSALTEAARQEVRQLRRQERRDKRKEWFDNFDFKEWVLYDDSILKCLSRIVLMGAIVVGIIVAIIVIATLVSEIFSPWVNILFAIPVLAMWIRWTLKD